MIDSGPARRSGGRIAALLAPLLLVGMPNTADAYTISNELSDGCHERMTAVALRAVRKDLATASPLAATKDERALIDDLQFAPDADMRDLGGATLLIAVRDNDLKGRAADDLSALTQVHGDPNAQQEHCLRGPEHKEPGGSKAAVDACRAFIRERALTAIGGLDDKGMPDLSKRTRTTINLAIRGEVHAPLPTYYIAAGAAIHAIEDSFTHTYRSADSTKITVVLNWLAQVNGNLVESRDGPGHAVELDRCDDPDELRKARRLLATEAATGFLRATLDPQKTKDEKMAAVDAVLDAYLSYSPGCTFDNGWCDAPENQYKDTGGCGCRVANSRGGRGAMFGGAAIIALAVAIRAGRRRRRTARGITVLGVLGALSFGAAAARAEPPPETTTTTTKPAQPATPTTNATPETTTTTTTTPSEEPGTAPTIATVKTTPTTTTTTVTTPTADVNRGAPPPTVVPVKEPGPVGQSQAAIGAYAGLSGSIEKPALAGTLGLRLRVTQAWTFGLDGEWNPWVAFNGTAIRKGAMNVYGTAMLRFPLAYENFNLRVGLSAGVSYLLMNLYGAPSGSLGLYFGASPLSVEWKLSRIFYFIINPINVALPIPQLKGVPLLYPQYRSTIGLEIYTG